MDAKVFAGQLIELAQDQQSKGNESLNCEVLIGILDRFIKDPSVEFSPDRMERYKADLQLMVEAEKSNHLSSLEMFRTVIQSGQNALKTAMLMNGGASIALLAFIGKLTEARQGHIPAFTNALAVFVLGVFCIVVASGTTYLSQWFYAEEDGWKHKTGFGFNLVSIFLGLSSYGLFLWAMTKAYAAFVAFG
jgi:hypothetical protein